MKDIFLKLMLDILKSYMIFTITFPLCYLHKQLMQAFNHGLVFKKVHRVIKLNQKAWLKLYIDVNTKLRKKAMYDFERDYLKLKNNAVFRKTMKNVGKHRDIKLITKRSKNELFTNKPV